MFFPSSTVAPHPTRVTPAQRHRADSPVASGRPLTRNRKESGRGSGSHLTRAFAGSKPLLGRAPYSLYTHCTGPYPRRRASDRCSMEQTARSPPHLTQTRLSATPLSRLRTDLPLYRSSRPILPCPCVSFNALIWATYSRHTAGCVFRNRSLPHILKCLSHFSRMASVDL